MLNLSKRARAAIHWTLAALFSLIGIWAIGQWWAMLDGSATWQSLLIPMLATFGAISLARREVQHARMQPARVRLERPRRR